MKNSNDEELSKRFLPQLLGLKGLTEGEKASVIFDMMLAAIDTTTYSIFRVMYFLSQNPQAQETLFNEIVEQIGATESTITPTALANMHYLKACIRESQRLKPLAPQLARSSPTDLVIKGYLIPKGTTIMTENEFASTQPEHFDDPMAYKPERWLRTPST